MAGDGQLFLGFLMDLTRPFLKWAGGKYRLLDRLLPSIPGGARLVEPFVGSGAVFLNAGFACYLLCDLNADLIGLYRTLRRDGERFIAEARALFTPGNNTQEAFLRLRETFNASSDAEERSVLFLYLNRHSYNGLVRYNSKGIYNVPFGKYKAPYFPERELTAFLDKLRGCDVTFAVQDFRSTFAALRPGDVVYCDPPLCAGFRHGEFYQLHRRRVRRSGADRSGLRGVRRGEAGRARGPEQPRCAAYPRALCRCPAGIVPGAAVHQLQRRTARGRARTSGGVPMTSEQGGAIANRQGNILEQQVRQAFASHGFREVAFAEYEKLASGSTLPGVPVPDLLVRRVPYQSIYGHRGVTEFLAVSASRGLAIRIECKWQQSQGSVDEKFPYLYLNCIQAMPEREIILLIDGNGYKPARWHGSSRLLLRRTPS